MEVGESDAAEVPDGRGVAGAGAVGTGGGVVSALPPSIPNSVRVSSGLATGATEACRRLSSGSAFGFALSLTGPLRPTVAGLALDAAGAGSGSMAGEIGCVLGSDGGGTWRASIAGSAFLAW